ncbi:uncharacterized protein [Leptinotarsa decemlineata]|uniref:uncharacterized protein n=1 Tax=Leptinotarsa decemlineata TaxID=7539 RepID=UPI003D30A608
MLDFNRERNGILIKMSSQKLSCVEEETLINLVKQYPALYNCKLKVYKDQTLKNNIWKTIANSLGRSEADCRARWKNIRDYYKKKRNEAMKNLTTGSERLENDFFQKFKHLIFLEDTSIVQRESCSSVVECTQDDNQESESVPELTTALPLEPEEPVRSEEQMPPLKATETSSGNVQNIKQTCQKSDSMREEKITSAKKKIRSSRENHFEEECRKNREGREALIKELCKPSILHNNSLLDPALSTFFQSMAFTVNKFTPALQAKAKAEVMNIVSRLEILNITEQQNRNLRYQSSIPLFASQFSPIHSNTSNLSPEPPTISNLNSPTYTDISYTYSHSSQPPSHDSSTCVDSDFPDNINFLS